MRCWLTKKFPWLNWHSGYHYIASYYDAWGDKIDEWECTKCGADWSRNQEPEYE